jgi:hypothetical protein
VKSDDTYLRWRKTTRAFVGGPQELRQLQDLRYAYAAEVGLLLTQPAQGDPPLTGPALYGVYSRGPGLIYVGQTMSAERRLRDLAVGESHHLANTVPPEVWDRVVVIQWPLLTPQLSPAAQNAVADLLPVVAGEGLERLLQVELRPLLNGRRRMPLGGWRDRGEGSSSRGAKAVASLGELHQLVLQKWTHLIGVPVAGAHLFEDGARVVLPSRLLDDQDEPRPSPGRGASSEEA